jgi:multidrug efflux pump subunit AcrA (membrane-fusion protein)
VPRQDKNQLFRKEALERLDDIDELDRLVTVTHPRAWLALGAVAALIITALVWASAGRLETTVSGQGMLLTGGHTLQVTTLGDGRLTEVLVGIGDHVSAGQTVAVVAPAAQPRQPQATEAVTSPYTGVVGSLQAYPGQYVGAGAPLITVDPSEPLVATLYLPMDDGKKVEVGQSVQIVPANVSVDEYGYLLGKVTFVAGLASTPESMQAVLQNEFLVQEFAAAGPVVRVQASLQRDRSTPSGYAWSSSDGPPDRVSTGTSCTARVVLSRAAPITYAFPALGRIAGGSE